MSLPTQSDDAAPNSKGRPSSSSEKQRAAMLLGLGVKAEPSATRFRPLFVVGSGGMGSVEVALEEHEGEEPCVVALKRMLPKAVLDKRQTEMFLREAKLASLLVHPNVVRATSFCEMGGELLLVMEYIEGEPLSSVLTVAREREEKLPLPFVLHVLAEICEGLHAAHELSDESGRLLNVVHRDISPQNVMVAYEGQIKLLDFGVAKIEAIESEGRTKTGEVKGKTAYMSPEQAMGDEIDRRSDLYSLGAVLFEAVSGSKMWGGGTDLEVIRKLALEEPPPLEKAAPGTPSAICDLQRRLVSRDPAKRPRTALEVASELRAFIATVTEPKPDANVVRTLMSRLFKREMERRHATLRAAIEKAAAGEPVGRTSEPAIVSSTDATPLPATTGTRRASALSPAHPRSRGLLLVASGVVLAALAGGVLSRKGGRTQDTPGSAASTASAATDPTRSESAVASPAVTSQGMAKSASDRATAPETSAQPSARKLDRSGESKSGSNPKSGSNLKASGPRPLPARAPATKPTAPLDVDPTPF